MAVKAFANPAGYASSMEAKSLRSAQLDSFKVSLQFLGNL